MKWFRGKTKNEPQVSVEQQRNEKLVEMGTHLKGLREQYGFNAEEVAIFTKIPRRLVQAIEDGNLHELPEPVYVQKLIKTYADALGLNGAEFSSQFPIGSNRVILKPTWKSTSVAQLRPFHLYGLYVLIILSSVSGLSHLLNTATIQASSMPNSLKSESLSEKQLETKPEVQPAVLETVSNTKQPSEEEVQIGVTLKAESWIKVVADGKTEFEGVLPEGTQRSWKAHDELTVKAGNAGGVLVSVNQQQAQQMGEEGKVKEMKVAAAKIARP
jgi:cytoskeletal protein RodZ